LVLALDLAGHAQRRSARLHLHLRLSDSVLPHPQPGGLALRQLERSVLRHQPLSVVGLAPLLLRQTHSEVRKLTPLEVLRQPERLARQRLPPSAPPRLLDLVEELHSLVPRSLGLGQLRLRLRHLDSVLQPQPLSARQQLHSVLLRQLLSARRQLHSALLHQLLSVQQLPRKVHQHLDPRLVVLLEAHKALAIQDTPPLTTTNQTCSL
jgi:hypothetical protein